MWIVVVQKVAMAICLVCGVKGKGGGRARATRGGAGAGRGGGGGRGGKEEMYGY